MRVSSIAIAQNTSFNGKLCIRDISGNKAKIYKEFEFIYKVENKEIHGIIDLMLEYDDHIDIIDYKLSNIQDEAYIKQLNTYKEYIESKSYKKVSIYLYSIMQSKFEKVVEL